MGKIIRYENGEIVFLCKCETQLILYCGEDNIGKVECENCGRKYIGTSHINVDELPERDIPILRGKVKKLESEMVDLIANKGQIEEGIIQLDYAINKAQDLLDREIVKNFKPKWEDVK